MTDTRKKSKYREAGVDIDRAAEVLRNIRQSIQSTHTPDVLSSIGTFGAPVRLDTRRYEDPVLVMSVDGVGTKLKLAFMTGTHDTVGQDLVNHCVNDILVQGARPIAFMDYFATGRLEDGVAESVIEGLAKACRENGCPLVGGETAEMPDFYAAGEYDLAGCIVGIADRSGYVDGSKVAPGDSVIGLLSTGLHTNGYTLARKIVFESVGLTAGDVLPGTDRTVGEVLLAVHRSYLGTVEPLLDSGVINAMVHITGGGFYENVPRVLPEGVTAVIETGNWTPGPVFEFLEKHGEVSKEEMYRVFNMGIGFLLVVPECEAGRVLGDLSSRGTRGVRIGRIEAGGGGVDVRLPD